MHLPGNLTSPRAGPILCPGAPVTVIRDTPEDPEGEPCDGFRVKPGTSATVTDAGNGEWCIVCGHVVDNTGPAWSQLATADVSLDLTADLGPTTALRWLGRHYEIDVGIGCPGWSRYGGTAPVWCLHTAKSSLWFASGGRSAVDRCATNIFDVPGISAITNPLEALVAACLHAAGV